jgi:TetR/AcrR family transcriptional regulator, regulator of autoinduction and epiphytic fitness
MSIADSPQKAGRRALGRPVSLVKRRAMLDAAIAEFQKCGYESASMDAIAAASAVSKRTLYNHFSSKEVLFRSLVDEMCKRVSLLSGLRYEPDVPVRDQLLRYAKDSARLIQDTETLALFRAVLAEHVRNPDLVASAMEQYWRDEYGFTEWVSAACRDGKLHARSPGRASRHFASLIKGIVVWPVVLRQATPKPRETSAAIQEAIDMFLAFYGTKPKA